MILIRRLYVASRANPCPGACRADYNQAMETELTQLEAKAARAVEQCERLRAENQDLRQQLAARTDEVKRLSEKLEESRRRIEGLLARMPG
jgi:cell division protein ZapB